MQCKSLAWFIRYVGELNIAETRRLLGRLEDAEINATGKDLAKKIKICRRVLAKHACSLEQCRQTEKEREAMKTKKEAKKVAVLVKKDEKASKKEAILKKATPVIKSEKTAKTAKSAKAEKTAKVVKTAKAAKAEKPVGVVGTIIEMLKRGNVTKKDILAELVARFPERNPEAMQRTLNCQLPWHLRKDKGLDIVKNEKGYSLAA